MIETLTLQPALRPINLVPIEEQQVGLQPTLLEQQQSAETTEQTNFLRKAGALAMKAAGLVEDKINKAAIYTQIKTWDAIETVTGAVEHTKDYLKLQGGRAVAHGALAGLAIAAGAGFMELKDSGTAYAAATNTISYPIDPDTAASGIFARSGPNSNDTTRTPGYGVYPRQTIDLLCGVTDGTAVGPYNNTTWHYVHDENNPGEGNFWLNDHYIQSSNTAGTLAPGESQCVDESANPMAAVSAPTPAPAQAANPDTPYFAQACVDDKGAIALQIMDNALGTIDYQATGDAIHENPNAGIQYKSSLEQYDVQWGNVDEPEIVCVGAQMSAPDTVNHQQFIGSVASVAPEDQSNCKAGTDVEIWGQGFYKKTHCTDSTAYTINQWLPSGTNVCAAISSESDYVAGYDGWGDTKVVGGPLDDKDPNRQIACFQIKA